MRPSGPITAIEVCVAATSRDVSGGGGRRGAMPTPRALRRLNAEV